jgi:hypothetical protein
MLTVAPCTIALFDGRVTSTASGTPVRTRVNATTHVMHALVTISACRSACETSDIVPSVRSRRLHAYNQQQEYVRIGEQVSS